MKILHDSAVSPIVLTQQTQSYTTGMTIRQQFAMAAMQGLICQANSSESAQDKYTCNGGRVEPTTLAKCSVEMADALIAELNKSEQ